MNLQMTLLKSFRIFNSEYEVLYDKDQWNQKRPAENHGFARETPETSFAEISGARL